MSRKFKLTLFWVLFVGLILLATALNILFPPQPITRVEAAEGSFDTLYSFILDHPEINLADAMGDQDVYESFKEWSSRTYGMTLPEWGDAASPSTQVQDYFRNVASGFIGQYAFPDQQTLNALVGVYEDLEDVLQFLTFDTDSGDFIVRSDDRAGFLGEINRHIYVEPPAGVIGSWLQTSNSNVKSIYQGAGFSGTKVSFRLLNSSWAQIPNNFYISVVGGSFIISSDIPGCIVYAYLNGTYQDYVYMNSTYTVDGVTYYYCKWGSSVAPNSSDFYTGDNATYPKYSSNNEALLDLWGTDHPSEPVLTGAIIVDEDPAFTPMSLPSSIYYDYSTKIVNNYEDDDNTPIPNNVYNFVPYTYNYNIPFDDYDYELPVYPQIPHDLPEVELSYPEVLPIQGLEEGLENLNGLWVTLLVMGGSFIVLKVIL